MRIRRRPKKAKTQRKHAKRRAYERFGIVLTREKLTQIVRSIQERPG